MPTPLSHDRPSLSRQTSQYGRTGRHPYRAGDPQRPGLARQASTDRRGSSPLRSLATFGLLASNVGLAHAYPRPSPEGFELQGLGSKMQQDGAQAMQMLRRDLPKAFETQRPARDASPGVFENIDWGDWSDASDADSAVSFAPPASRPSTPILTRRDRQAASPPASGAITQPAVAAPEKALAPQGSTPNDAQLFAGIGPGQNAVAIIWRGDYVATFNAYANAGPYQPGLGEAYKSVTVQPGKHALMALPQGWSGRVQLMSGSGNAADPASWSELTFQGWKSLTWFDCSVIRGLNAALSMRASDGSSQAAIPAGTLEKAPHSIKMQDSGGRWVIKDTETYTGSVNQDAIDWLQQDLPPGAAYIRNWDNAATHATRDQHLVLEFSV